MSPSAGPLTTSRPRSAPTLVSRRSKSGLTPTSGSSVTIVINLSGETGTAWNTAYAYEVAGLATTGVIDQTAGTGAALEATVTTWSSGATPQTLQASEFWAGIAGASWTSPETITGQAGPWTNLPAQATTSPSDLQVVSGYQITGATGQATYSGTSGGAELWNT